MKKFSLMTVFFLLLAGGNVHAQGAENADYRMLPHCPNSSELHKLLEKEGASDWIMLVAAKCFRLKEFIKLVKEGGNIDGRANIAFRYRADEESVDVWLRNASPFMMAAFGENERKLGYFLKKVKEGKVNPNHVAEIKVDPSWTFTHIDALGAVSMRICDDRYVGRCIKPTRTRVRKIAEVTNPANSNALLWTARGGDVRNMRHLHTKGFKLEGKLGPFNALQVAIAGPFMESAKSYMIGRFSPIGKSMHESAVRWIMTKGIKSDAKTLALALGWAKVMKKASNVTYPRSIIDALKVGVDMKEVEDILQEICSKGPPSVFTAPPSPSTPTNKDQPTLAVAFGPK